MTTRVATRRGASKRVPRRKSTAAKTTTAPISSNGSAPRAGGRGGARLAAAFEAVEAFPVLAAAREGVMGEAGAGDLDRLVSLIESDPGLTIATLRAANRERGRGGIGSVRAALDVLGGAGVSQAIGELRSYDLFDAGGPWGAVPEAMRRHGVATRIAAERIGEIAGLPARDELAAAALLHDIGRLVLICLYGEYSTLISDPGLGPEDRLRIERRELGIDHALVGAVLARRIGVPAEMASAIERHHGAGGGDTAVALGLADLVAHHVHGETVSSVDARTRADSLGIEPAALRALLFEFPYSLAERPRASEPCPLSARELDALRGLAGGKVYKEIAAQMDLSPSTVRTHLHNVYRKIGATDRAQAVLVARDRGWV